MPPAIKACLFDMDGLLLNTEDLITTCINVILQQHGKSSLPWSIKARMQGRIAKDSDDILLQWAQLPITKSEYSSQLDSLRAQHFPTSETLPGSEKLLKELEKRNTAQLALATSSSRSKFELKTVKWTSLFECFPPDCRVLGDDPRVQRHKPAPDIYLCALQCVNKRQAQQGKADIAAEECLVFEDAIQGVDAGKQAGMQVIWRPHQGLTDELLYGDSDDVRDHLRKVLSLPDDLSLKNLTFDALAGHIKEATDNMVRLVSTLENFPYSDYGL